MYPDLSYLFDWIPGVVRDGWLSVFKTFGLFLLLAFLAAAALLRRELRRREAVGQLRPTPSTQVPGQTVTTWDYIFNALFGFVLGYKLPYAVANFESWRQDPGGVLLSLEGWWWTGLLGAAGYLAYYYNIARKQPGAGEAVTYDVYPSDRVAPITMAAAVGGLLGAKFFAIIEYLPRFFEDPLGVLLSGDGLAIYGGLIGGGLAVGLYLRRHKIPVLPVTDAVAPALIIAYGIGRIGCQLSGDGDWGKVAGAQPEWWFLPDALWSQQFAHNVIRRGIAIPDCTVDYCRMLPEGVYPTSVYETLMAFGIGALLWSVRKRWTAVPGLLFAAYLFLNGLERFFIEFVRVNDRYEVLGAALSQAQLIAIGFMAAGIALGSWARSRVRGEVGSA